MVWTKTIAECTSIFGKEGIAKMVKMKCHYVAMSGLMGCLPDTCQSFNHFNDAVEFLAELWEDDHNIESDLRQYSYWERNLNEHDLMCCEIVECDCNNPECHNNY